MASRMQTAYICNLYSAFLINQQHKMLKKSLPHSPVHTQIPNPSDISILNRSQSRASLASGGISEILPKYFDMWTGWPRNQTTNLWWASPPEPLSFTKAAIYSLTFFFFLMVTLSMKPVSVLHYNISLTYITHLMHYELLYVFMVVDRIRVKVNPKPACNYDYIALLVH